MNAKSPAIVWPRIVSDAPWAETLRYGPLSMSSVIAPIVRAAPRPVPVPSRNVFVCVPLPATRSSLPSRFRSPSASAFVVAVAPSGVDAAKPSHAGEPARLRWRPTASLALPTTRSRSPSVSTSPTTIAVTALDTAPTVSAASNVAAPAPAGVVFLKSTTEEAPPATRSVSPSPSKSPAASAVTADAVRATAARKREPAAPPGLFRYTCSAEPSCPTTRSSRPSRFTSVNRSADVVAVPCAANGSVSSVNASEPPLRYSSGVAPALPTTTSTSPSPSTSPTASAVAPEPSVAVVSVKMPCPSFA